jgi:hypothetical protein
MNHVDNHDPETGRCKGVEEPTHWRQETDKAWLNLTTITNRYNAEVDSIAKQYNRPHMVAEVRRDMKIMDRIHDRSQKSPEAPGHILSTYNTLTNV